VPTVTGNAHIEERKIRPCSPIGRGVSLRS
jgi:hypothetical protein